MEMTEKQLHILKKAEELFATKGFEGTSVRDIAQAADINVAMISYYFGSKEKLLESLLSERGERFKKLMDSLNQKKSLGPLEKLEQVIDFFVEAIFKNRDFHTIMTRRFSLPCNAKFNEKLIEIKKQNSKIIVNLLNEGQATGAFKKVDNELTIGTIMGTINQIFLSKGYYADLLEVAANDEATFYQLMEPKLKNHLKTLIKAHLLNNFNQK